ncbi:hypothetical protein [Nocardioides zeae]
MNDINPEQRRRNLAQAIQTEVATGGWRVESQTDESAVLAKGGATNHVLHLLLSIFTCGLWAIVWVVMVVMNQRKVLVLRVDEFGNVLRA